MKDELLTTEELAARLKMSVGTLMNWRSQGKGPRFLKLEDDTVRYRMLDVVEWEEKNTNG
jgi:predicted DNA-binding transcriptional regulator AlpA